MANKLVIFDFDGTLCNSLPDIVYYANQSLEKHGYATKSESEIRDTVCLPIEEIFSLLTGEDVRSQIVKQTTDYYKKQIKDSKSPRTTLYDGISELLIELKRQDYKIAILTNKSEDEMQVIYQRLLSGFGFDAVIGLKDGVVAKPNPREIYNLMDKFGADNQNTYFIGDGDTDVLAANNAGVNLIAVTYGYRDKEHLQKLGATVLADTPKDIQSLILR